MAEARPRGTCSVCGKEVALKKDGTVQGHGFTHMPATYWCPGSMELPVERDVSRNAPSDRDHFDIAPIAVPDVGYDGDYWPESTP